jgi:hypothetical protein
MTSSRATARRRRRGDKMLAMSIFANCRKRVRRTKRGSGGRSRPAQVSLLQSAGTNVRLKGLGGIGVIRVAR